MLHDMQQNKSVASQQQQNATSMEIKEIEHNEDNILKKQEEILHQLKEKSSSRPKYTPPSRLKDIQDHSSKL